MQTTIADERMLIFKDQLSEEQSKDIAWAKKVDAFGTIMKFASLLSPPKDDDFKIIYSEHRYQPIWHVKGAFNYVYDRKTTYLWTIKEKEVKRISIDKKDYSLVNGQIEVEATDHCIEEEQLEFIVNGISSEKQPSLNKYFAYGASVATKKQLDQLNEDKIIMIPPKTRVSALINEIIGNSIKVIHADKVFEENIDISNVDLYYRPVHAFQVQWISKKKEIVIEVDGLTGEVSFGNKIFKEYSGKAIDINFLFDLGADAAGMFVPGGSIAVKIAKKYIDSKIK